MVKRTWKLLGIAAIVLWPFAVYWGLGHFEPKDLVIILLAVAWVRRGTCQSLQLLRSVEWVVLGVTGLLAAAIIWSNSEPLLRLYPVVISLGLLAVFAHSLFYPPSLVERIARIKDPDLSGAGVAYTRRVTQIWCGFFLVNGTLSALSALIADRKTWALYNGFISYLLIGLLVCGEWLVRRRRFPKSTVS